MPGATGVTSNSNNTLMPSAFSLKGLVLSPPWPAEIVNAGDANMGSLGEKNVGGLNQNCGKFPGICGRNAVRRDSLWVHLFPCIHPLKHTLAPDVTKEERKQMPFRWHFAPEQYVQEDQKPDSLMPCLLLEWQWCLTWRYYFSRTSLMFESLYWCSVISNDCIHCCKRCFSELLDHLNAEIFSDALSLSPSGF